MNLRGDPRNPVKQLARPNKPRDWQRNAFEVAAGLRNAFSSHSNEKIPYLESNDPDFKTHGTAGVFDKINKTFPSFVPVIIDLSFKHNLHNVKSLLRGSVFEKGGAADSLGVERDGNPAENLLDVWAALEVITTAPDASHPYKAPDPTPGPHPSSSSGSRGASPSVSPTTSTPTSPPPSAAPASSLATGRALPDSTAGTDTSEGEHQQQVQGIKMGRSGSLRSDSRTPPPAGALETDTGHGWGAPAVGDKPRSASLSSGSDHTGVESEPEGPEAAPSDYNVWGIDGPGQHMSMELCRFALDAATPAQTLRWVRSKRALGAAFNRLVLEDGDSRQLVDPELVAKIFESLIHDCIFANYFGPCPINLCITILRNGLESTAYSEPLLRMALEYLHKAYGGWWFPVEGIDSAVRQDAVMLLPLAKLVAFTNMTNKRATMAALATAQEGASAQAARGVPLTTDQQHLQQMLLALRDKRHLQFLHLYAAASKRLQVWFYRPLTRLFGEADKFKLQAPAFRELQRSTAGQLDRDTLMNRLLFYRAAAPAGAYLPLYTGAHEKKADDEFDAFEMCYGLSGGQEEEEEEDGDEEGPPAKAPRTGG